MSNHSTDDAELVALRRWKAEALEVIDGLQDLGQALGLPLGERITGTSAAEVAKALRADRDRWIGLWERASNAYIGAQGDLEALRAQVARVRALAEHWEGMAGAFDDTNPKEARLTGLSARELRAALDGDR